MLVYIYMKEKILRQNNSTKDTSPIIKIVAVGQEVLIL